VQEFLRVHGEQLPRYLGRREGHVLPGVRAVLEDLAGRDDVRSYLLTGNIEAGARAKLAHYGLAEFFPDGGGFCIGAVESVEVARRALPLAEGAARVYVVGDTPADVACGKEIGARTIAVATGSFAAEELGASRPWAVLERLPPPLEFNRLLGLVE
jgi:phosphoglycolate phosphatase